MVFWFRSELEGGTLVRILGALKDRERSSQSLPWNTTTSRPDFVLRPFNRLSGRVFGDPYLLYEMAWFLSGRQRRGEAGEAEEENPVMNFEVLTLVREFWRVRVDGERSIYAGPSLRRVRETG